MFTFPGIERSFHCDFVINEYDVNINCQASK